MKKLTLSILSLIFLLCAAFGLVGCDKEKHTHSFTEQKAEQQYLASAATCTEAAKYYYSCSCGEKGTETFTSETPLGHSFIDYISDNNATCATDGTKTATCDHIGCNAKDTVTDTGSKLPHNFDEGVTIEPTCAKDGETTKTCLACGKTEKIVLPASHKGEWHITAKPRCLDDGERQRICTVCDEIETEIIPAYGQHDLKDATCEGAKACSRCGYSEGVAAGHAFGEWKTIKEATCTELGKKQRVCLVCKKTEEDDIAIKSHAYGEWTTDEQATCSSEGFESRVCTVCGDKQKRDAQKLPHTLIEYVNVKYAN